MAEPARPLVVREVPGLQLAVVAGHSDPECVIDGRHAPVRSAVDLFAAPDGSVIFAGRIPANFSDASVVRVMVGQAADNCSVGAGVWMSLPLRVALGSQPLIQWRNAADHPVSSHELPPFEVDMVDRAGWKPYAPSPSDWLAGRRDDGR
jgi:hypothetical protein